MPKLLIVESQPELAEVLAAAAEEFGLAPLIARSGRDALALAGGSQPRVALVELVLPDMSGRALVRHLYEHAIPCVAMSEIPDGDPRVLEALQAGAAEFIHKPFDPRALIASLAERASRPSRNAGGNEVDAEELLPLDQPAPGAAAMQELLSEVPIAPSPVRPPSFSEPDESELLDAQQLEPHPVALPAASAALETRPAASPVPIALLVLAPAARATPEAFRDSTSATAPDAASPAAPEAVPSAVSTASPAAAGAPPSPTSAAASTAVPSAASTAVPDAAPAPAADAALDAAPRPTSSAKPGASAASHLVLPPDGHSHRPTPPIPSPRPASFSGAQMTPEWPLEGNPAQYPLARLLAMFQGGRLTGELRLRRREVLKVFALREGRLAFCASNVRAERLAPFALRVGKLSPEDAASIQREAASRKQRTGEAMVALGLISQADLIDLVAHQAREILWSALDWADGSYQAVLGPLLRPGLLDLGLVPSGPLVLEGFRRTSNLVHLRELIAPSARFQGAPDAPLEPRDLSLSEGESLVLAHADDSKTVEDLILLSGIGERSALAILRGLSQMGMLRPCPAPVARARVVLV